MVVVDYLKGLRRERGDVVKAVALLAVGLPAVAIAVVVLGFFATLYLFRPTITIATPKVGTLAETSRLFAADGSLIASFHAEHDRRLIPISQVPKHLQHAVMAAEDRRFYEHNGVDFEAVLRAFVANLRSGDTLQGGSTITQQYAKRAYVGSRRTFLRKVREAHVALELERRLSKEQILERYLNTVYFGRGAYGVEAAARSYFAKRASDLSVSEAALLAGLLRAPDRLSPFSEPGAAEVERRRVIRIMRDVGFLDHATAAGALRDKPVVAKPVRGEKVRRFPWFVDAVRRYLLNKYGEEAVYDGGLEVFTTVDPVRQQAAEDALRTHLPEPADPYGAVVSIEPETGYVRALVGGRDFHREKFNIAIQGARQPGSAFKPFVLVAALEHGVSPRDRFRGPATICLRGWKPACTVHNFANQSFGSITLTEATVRSVNTVFAQLALDVGADKIRAAARRMGINGQVERTLGVAAPAIEAVPAIALGSEEATPLAMASAYATLAARGTWREPRFVTKVVDGSGKVLESGPAPAVRAVPPAIADTVNGILRGVIERGTGRQADIARPAAGKTGTASDHRNAWFVGYTPDLATATWVGYRDVNRQLFGIHGIARVTGGTLPARIWRDYMRTALRGTPASVFAEHAAPPSRRFRLPATPHSSCLPPIPGTSETPSPEALRSSSSPTAQYPSEAATTASPPGEATRPPAGDGMAGACGARPSGGTLARHSGENTTDVVGESPTPTMPSSPGPTDPSLLQSPRPSRRPAPLPSPTTGGLHLPLLPLFR